MHPLLGADLRTLVRLTCQNGPVPIKHWPMMTAFGLSALFRSPFALAEGCYVAKAKGTMGKMPAPVIIVGHWRSGTTHLYNILAQAEFGYVTPFAAGMPAEMLSLGRWLRPLLAMMLPATRYVDQIAVHPNSPQEDEIPMGSINPISFYHGIYFPKHFARHLHRSFFLEGCTADEIRAWKYRFAGLMDKLWIDKEKRLLVKNPALTARIPVIRELYPDARFIHIYRNPHDVFRSTRQFYRTLLEHFALQAFDHLDIEPLVLEGYRRMMERLAIDSRDLPENRFIDIRFEDLEAEPLDQIRRIYRQLDLGDVTLFEPRFEAYLKTVCNFPKAIYRERPEDVAMIEHHWRPFVERFGYGVPRASGDS
ncbi:MAG: sulfotransferase family protein [Geminicoccaceae bacterium]